MCIVHFKTYDLIFIKKHDWLSLGNLTKKDLVCQFLRKLDGKPIPDPQRAFKPFLDIKPREDVSHNHNYMDGGEEEEEAMGKWGVCCGATDGRIGVLFEQVGKMVGWKNWGGFKGGRCVGCVEGTGVCVICSEFAKGKIFSWKWKWQET